MQIEFLGAAQTVTGSQHLLTVNGKRLLLECGLFQGRRQESYERNRNFPFDPKTIDAVILSHAHIDHSGNLPNLVKQGYAGKIYGTHATCHLADLMLRDSGHIHEADAEFVNKRRKRRGEAPIEALYTREDAGRVREHFVSLGYDEPFEPLPGVRATLVEAGHILGSAAVSLELEERGTRHRLWFSGDIGRRDLPLLRDPVLPEPADTLIMECTYGDTAHHPPEQAFDELRQVVGRTVRRGGKVIIPAFAVGRTQELVYCLHQMMDGGEVPRVPVYVDSPLAVSASEIFRQHPECFDAETVEFIRNDRHKAALGFDHLTYVRTMEQSKWLNKRKEPMVIISASGMAETGRILHHLRNNIENRRNTILIVSWQAPYTLGRRLAEQEQQVKIFGEVFERRAEVATINGFSAHAGQELLVEYAKAVMGQARQVFLVHGERRGAEPLMGRLNEAGLGQVVFPAMGTRVEI